MGSLWDEPASVRRSVRAFTLSKIFSETAWPIKAGTNVFINNPCHMTKMATVPIYGKNPSKISGTARQISTKLGMKHR